MSEKTLLSVFLPATGNSYDIWVPRDLTVWDATQLITRLLAEREARFFAPTATTALYSASNGAELRADMLVGNLDLHNGARLILV